MNNVTINTDVQILRGTYFSFFLEVKLLDHMASLCLTFWKNDHQTVFQNGWNFIFPPATKEVPVFPILFPTLVINYHLYAVIRTGYITSLCLSSVVKRDNDTIHPVGLQ